MNLSEFEKLFKPKKISVNVVIIVLNLLVYAFEFFVLPKIYGMTGLSSNDFQLKYSLYGPGIQNREYYRFFTCMFLHANERHILNNMAVLYFMGNFSEQLLGSVRHLFIYILSGLAASFGSYMFNGLGVYSVGASGAIFGIIGSVLFLVVFERKKIGISKKQIIAYVVTSLYTGFTTGGVDNAAHVAGLIGGFILCAITSFILFIVKKIKNGYSNNTSSIA